MTLEAEKQVLDGLSFDLPAHERMDLVEGLGHADEPLDQQFLQYVLIQVLKKDPNAIVRHEAAFSLGSLHCRGRNFSGAAIEALCDAAQNDPSNVVRHEAAEVLGWIVSPKVRKVLELLLCDISDDVVDTARISLDRHNQQCKCVRQDTIAGSGSGLKF